VPRSNGRRTRRLSTSVHTVAAERLGGRRARGPHRGDGPGLDALAQEKLIAADTRVDLARALIARVRRRGAPSPDLLTTETFRRDVLASEAS